MQAFLTDTLLGRGRLLVLYGWNEGFVYTMHDEHQQCWWRRGWQDDDTEGRLCIRCIVVIPCPYVCPGWWQGVSRCYNFPSSFLYSCILFILYTLYLVYYLYHHHSPSSCYWISLYSSTVTLTPLMISLLMSYLTMFYEVLSFT